LQNNLLREQLEKFSIFFKNQDYEKAEHIAEFLSKNYPTHPFGWKAKSILYKKKGNYDKALIFIKKAIELSPFDPETYNNQGVLLLEIKDYKKAILSFSKAIDLKRDYYEAFFNTAISFEKLNNFKKAILNYNLAIDLNQNFVEAYNNLGALLFKINKYDEAEKILKKITNLNINFPEPYNNLGNVLEKMNKLDEAEASYKKAIDLNQFFSEPYNNLGNVYKKKTKLDDAEANYKKAIDLNPNFAEAYYNLGILLVEKNIFNEAILKFKKAININKNFSSAENQLISLEKIICNFKISDKIKILTKKLGIYTESVSPFFGLSWDDNPKQQFERTKNYIKENYNIKYDYDFDGLRKHKKCLKIGFFCSDFYEFPTMCLLIRLLETLDRENFEIFAFSYGAKKNDNMKNRIISAVDEFIDIHNLPTDEIIKIARNKQIDISIDLNGHIKNSRIEIFQQRVSPIQINYLGYPGTIAADFMDYIIADPILINSKNRKFYSEKVIYMPNTYQPNDELREIDLTPTKRSNFNLPKNAFVLCCFNQSYKIGFDEFNIWIKILRKIPDSVLWLLKPNKLAEENLIYEFKRQGLDPSRLIFAEKLPNSKHLARHKHADLFVDTFNYNAHTTASDALWSGLPIITKIGNQFSARVCASLLSAIGLPELITNTVEEYENLILDFAFNREKLDKIKIKLAQNINKEALFDSIGYTRNFEKALKKTFEIYLKYKKPQDIWLD